MVSVPIILGKPGPQRFTARKSRLCCVCCAIQGQRQVLPRRDRNIVGSACSTSDYSFLRSVDARIRSTPAARLPRMATSTTQLRFPATRLPRSSPSAAKRNQCVETTSKALTTAMAAAACTTFGTHTMIRHRRATLTTTSTRLPFRTLSVSTSTTLTPTTISTGSSRTQVSWLHRESEDCLLTRSRRLHLSQLPSRSRVSSRSGSARFVILRVSHRRARQA